MGTAFLHSIMVQERRGILKVWNASLIVATFSLALLGTFLVRSGVLESIHAFGASTVGGPILALIAVVVIGSTLLIISRLDDLRSEKRIDSLLSREAIFLVNNLLLVALCAVIFWGTFFPLIAELFTGERASLAAPWFDRYTTPLAIVLVLFTGIGPLVAWRRITWASARRVFAWPATIAATVIVAALALSDAGQQPWALVLFGFAAFALAALAQEFWRGAAARRTVSGGSWPGSLLGVASRNRRRYGGYIVHAGIATLLIGVAASSSFQTKRDVTLAPGESATVAGYRLTYARPTVDVNNERIAFGAVLNVRRDGEHFATLQPTRGYYRPSSFEQGPIKSFFAGEAESEVGMRAGLRRDLWTAVQPNIGPILREAAKANRRFERIAGGFAAEVRGRPAAMARAGGLLGEVQGEAIRRIAQSYIDSSPAATFRVLVNPLVSWLWIGALISLSGALIAIWPSAEARRRRVTSLYGARLGRELSRA
jgi:cytochrome c-type biogenesis protein CcmF